VARATFLLHTPIDSTLWDPLGTEKMIIPAFAGQGTGKRSRKALGQEAGLFLGDPHDGHSAVTTLGKRRRLASRTTAAMSNPASAVRTPNLATKLLDSKVSLMEQPWNIKQGTSPSRALFASCERTVSDSWIQNSGRGGRT